MHAKSRQTISFRDLQENKSFSSRKQEFQSIGDSQPPNILSLESNVPFYHELKEVQQKVYQ